MISIGMGTGFLLYLAFCLAIFGIAVGADAIRQLNRTRIHHRDSLGFCPKCNRGFIIRGNVRVPRCPECASQVRSARL